MEFFLAMFTFIGIPFIWFMSHQIIRILQAKLGEKIVVGSAEHTKYIKYNKLLKLLPIIFIIMIIVSLSVLLCIDSSSSPSGSSSSRYKSGGCPWIYSDGSRCGRSVASGDTYCSVHQKDMDKAWDALLN